MEFVVELKLTGSWKIPQYVLFIPETSGNRINIAQIHCVHGFERGRHAINQEEIEPFIRCRGYYADFFVCNLITAPENKLSRKTDG